MSLKLLAEAVRLPFISGSLLPVLQVAVWQRAEPGFSWWAALVTLLGVGLLQSASNLINDYCDAGGSDPLNRQVTPFSGGSRVIQEGRLSRDAVLKLSMLFFVAALACGLVMAGTGRPWVLAVGTAGLCLGYFYSATAGALMLHGLGEAAIFLAFGPILSWGAGYAIGGEFSWGAFLLGLPLAWLITAVLWINQFPDLEADAAAGKRNLVVRMGTAKARIIHIILMLLPFPTLVVLVELAGFTPWLYLGVGSLPFVLGDVWITWRYHDQFTILVKAQALTIASHISLGLLTSLGLWLA